MSGAWSDLSVRIASGVALAAFGVADILIGGWIFLVTVWIACGIMIWELARMFGSNRAAILGCLAAAALAVATVSPGVLVLPLLLAAAFSVAADSPREKGAVLGYSALVLLACYAIEILRTQVGLSWFLWMIAVVIISDVMGYFAGRMLGGPKFWPRISPKKTWSGTVAGWAGAALVGVVFIGPLAAGAALVLVSIVTAFSGQMGDIAESAVKRRAGVKDSSALIPGHGGLLDRFDAMMGASVIVVALWGLGLLPGGA